MAAIFARSLRAALLEIMHRPYVQVARSYGLSNGFIFRNYVLRNALIPYVTIIGLQIRYVMGGVVVIERVFGIPGIGSLMVDAAFGRDYPVIQACTITFLVVVMATNVAMDLLVTRLNPRARA
jgi:peptide/nickel transport system permease protein